MNTEDRRGELIGTGPGAGRVYTRAELREIDRLAVERWGVPSIVLMENASRGLAGLVMREPALRASPGRVVVVAGPGNNGGDGLAAARHLANAGIDVGVWLIEPGREVRGDAAINLRVAQQMGLIVDGPEWCDGPQWCDGPAAVVDAMFGTGLERPMTGEAARAAGVIAAWRAAGARVIAADVPSGLDADVGVREGWPVVRADVTASFVGFKPGLLTAAGAGASGRVELVDIGAPRALVMSLGVPLDGRLDGRLDGPADGPADGRRGSG